MATAYIRGIVVVKCVMRANEVACKIGASGREIGSIVGVLGNERISIIAAVDCHLRVAHVICSENFRTEASVRRIVAHIIIILVVPGVHVRLA